MKFKVKVRCTLEVDLDVARYESWPEDEREVRDLIRFQIEENSCPGTGVVGAIIDRTQKECGDKICWACVLHGENTIVSLERVE
jgi:hypothetical protein